ncbi:MAG: hypothetical protein QXL96_04950 [Ignisphaera sp.]
MSQASALSYKVNDVEKIILEELADVVMSIAQYVKEIKYVKRFNKTFL